MQKRTQVRVIETPGDKPFQPHASLESSMSLRNWFFDLSIFMAWIDFARLQAITGRQLRHPCGNQWWCLWAEHHGNESRTGSFPPSSAFVIVSRPFGARLAINLFVSVGSVKKNNAASKCLFLYFQQFNSHGFSLDKVLGLLPCCDIFVLGAFGTPLSGVKKSGFCRTCGWTIHDFSHLFARARAIEMVKEGQDTFSIEMAS